VLFVQELRKDELDKRFEEFVDLLLAEDVLHRKSHVAHNHR
jgi:hypothetical protein